MRTGHNGLCWPPLLVHIHVVFGDVAVTVSLVLFLSSMLNCFWGLMYHDKKKRRFCSCLTKRLANLTPNPDPELLAVMRACAAASHIGS